MKKIIVLCLLLGTAVSVYSQKLFSISGQIADSLNGSPIKPALVMVVSRDSLTKVVGGEYNTSFRLSYEPKPDKKYLLYVFATGYQSKYMDITGRNGDIGTIHLQEMSRQLKEVVVKAEALPHEVIFGDDVYTITGSILADEYSLYTLLSHLPGLYVQGKGVEIVGKGIPVITINGQKPRKGELDMIVPSDIEKVVVNRAPSVKYGSAEGVIDIRLKKKLRDYINTMLDNTTMWGLGYNKNNGTSLLVSNKIGKWFNYINYNYTTAWKRIDQHHIYEETFGNDRNTQENWSVGRDRSKGHSFLIGSKYNITDNSYVDIQYNYGFDKSNDTSVSDMVQWNLNEDKKENIGQKSLMGLSTPSHQVATRYYIEGKKGNTFVTNLAFAENKRTSEQNIVEQGNSEELHTFLETSLKNRVMSVDMDYMQPIGKRMNLDVGWQYSFIHSRSNTVYDGNLEDSRSFRTNIKDHMANAYANLRFMRKRFMLEGGLRSEYNRRIDRDDEENSFHSFDVLPRMRMAYTLSSKSSLAFDYSYSVEHPPLRMMRPTPYYVNKFMYTIGNPNLKLSNKHDMNLSLYLPGNVSLTASYVYVKNKIIGSYLLDKDNPNVVVSTYSNLKKSHNLQLTVSYMHSFGRWYTFMITGNGYFPFTKAPYLTQIINYSKPSYSFYCQNTFVIAKGLYASLNARYNSKSVTFPLTSAASYNMNISMSYSIKNWYLSLVCNNLLYRSIVPTTSQHLNIFSRQEVNLHQQYLTFSISYRFETFKNLFERNNAGAKAVGRAN